MSRWESGKDGFRLSTLERIAAALGMAVEVRFVEVAEEGAVSHAAAEPVRTIILQDEVGDVLGSVTVPEPVRARTTRVDQLANLPDQPSAPADPTP